MFSVIMFHILADIPLMLGAIPILCIDLGSDLVRIYIVFKSKQFSGDAQLSFKLIVPRYYVRLRET